MRLWPARILIAAVVAWNVQAALVFLLRPEVYAPGFQVSGEAGEAMVRGLGVLFLMWNVPYLVALWHPVRHRVSLYEACAMQTIGLAGESLIYLTLSPELAVARASVGRFILFDATGLVALLAAAWLTRRVVQPYPPTASPARR
jgi:hypothetical protein